MAPKSKSAKKKTPRAADKPQQPDRPTSDTAGEEAAYIPPICTVAEAARALRVGKSTIYRAVEAGAISVLRVGSAVRIRRDDLLAYLERSKSPPEQAPGGADSPPQARKPRTSRQPGKRPRDWREYLGLT